MRLLLRNKKTYLLLMPFILALIGIQYGLPMHFIGDEESLIGGALKMLELRNFVPASNPTAFSFYYYPPVLGYLVILASLPVIIINFLSLGFSLQELQNFFALNQDTIWLSARILTALTSIGVIVTLYQIAKKLFNQRIALFSAVILSTGFFHVVLSHWMRPWMYAAFFAYLAFLFGLLFIENKKKKWALLTGVVAGLGFGATYISALGFAAVLVYWWAKRRDISNFWSTIIKASIVFMVIGVGLSLLNLPELIRILGPVDGTLAQAKSLSGLLAVFGNFISILWRQEIVLIILSIASLLLWRKHRQTILFILGSLITYILILYFFFHLELRYVYLIIPGLSILGGLVLNAIYQKISNRIELKNSTKNKLTKKAPALMVIILILIWPAVSIAKYEYLLLKQDTREQTVAWIQKNIPDHELFILSSATIELPRTRTSLDLDQKYGRIRAKERYLLKHESPDEGKYNFVNIHFWQDINKHAKAIQNFLQDRKPRYFIVDYRNQGELDEAERALIERGVLVARFQQSKLSDTIDMNGNFHEFNSILFKLDRLGPFIDVYAL